MRGIFVSLVATLGLVAAAMAGTTGMAGKAAAAKPADAGDWAMNATIIEACSCPMFCQCYFNAGPSGHEGHEGHAGGHFCKFNNAYRVNHGHYGAVKLDGAKFWGSGDLGGDFSTGKMDWIVVTFDKSVTPEQRDAIGKIMGAVYPVEWGSFKTAEGTMEWTAGKDTAWAKLDGGKTAEVKLHRPETAANGAGDVVIKNLKYWGTPRNTGFVLMPNEIEAYHAGDKPFEYKGTNGFMITFDITSKDVPPAAPAKAS